MRKEFTVSESKQDAIALLKSDHREAEKLFGKFDLLKDFGKNDEKREVVRKVCAALLVHMQIEESIFYPAVREKIDDDELIDESFVEHQGAKELILELGELDAASTMFDAKTKVLREQIQHHVDEEESELFPKVRESQLDLQALGASMARKKAELEKSHNMDGN